MGIRKIAAPVVPPRGPSDQMVRLIARLPISVRDKVVNYARMIEEIEEQAGRPPKRRADRPNEPASATVDYVLATMIVKGLATEERFLAWEEQRASQTAAATHTAESPHDRTA